MLPLQLALIAAPLVGWGLDDVRGFATSVARMTVLVVAALSCLLVARQASPAKPFAAGVAGPSRRRAMLLVMGVLSVPVLLGWFAYADRRQLLVLNDLAAVRWIGVATYGLAELVRVVALRALGKQYSAYVTVQGGHVLVRESIYAVVRHPIYLAQLLAVPGMALAFRSLLAAPILVLSALFVAKRIGKEEALLARTFPEEFTEYVRRTWRLIPFVY